MAKKLYSYTVTQVRKRIHYIWAEDPDAAADIAEELDLEYCEDPYDLVDQTWDVNVCINPEIIEAGYSELIVNPEDKEVYE